jgi:hypothetical protein
MPTQLTLHVITAADVPSPPPLNALDGVSLTEWFAQETSRELVLDIREHRSGQSSVDIAGDGLQAMFREFVPSPTPGTLASEIALLFCRSWCFRNLAGLMFDYDGADLPPGARLSFDGVPRQACAVFLDGLESSSDRSALYVAAHELGHVFNLHHDKGNASFMGFDVTGPRAFLETDRAKLTAAARGLFPERTEHLPGGAPFSASAGFSTPRPATPGRRTRRGAVEVRLGAASFLIGEPIVLDVGVRCPKGTWVAAGGLEPGFDGVRVWYRTPVGETRLFAPIRHYCTVGRPRSTRRAGVIRNNMRVHLGRRGLSFGHPGTYTLWVEVDLHSQPRRRSTLVSPAVVFDIRRPRDPQEYALTVGFSDPQIAHFVANRSGILDAERAEVVTRLLVDASTSKAARHLRYAAATTALRSGEGETAKRLLQGLRFPERSLGASVRRLRRTLSHQVSKPGRGTRSPHDMRMRA